MPLSIAINRCLGVEDFSIKFLTITINRGHLNLISALVAAGADLSNEYLGVCYKSLAESHVARHVSRDDSTRVESHVARPSSSSDPPAAAACISLLLSLGSSSSSSSSFAMAWCHTGRRSQTPTPSR